MSNFQDRIRKFMRGDYEKFEQVETEEKLKNVSACIKAFKTKLSDAIDAMKVAKENAIVPLTESLEKFNSIINDVKKTKKIEVISETINKINVMLQVECDKDQIAEINRTLNIIKENFDLALKEAGLDDTVLNPVKKIRISYETWTDKDVESGDTDDKGWENEEGVDIKDVDDAIQFLKSEGVVHSSSSQFHPGVWYSSETDMQTHERTIRSFHLDGFTDEEQKQIYDSINKMSEDVDTSAIDPASVDLKASIPTEEDPLAVVEESNHDAIPGVELGDVGKELNATEDKEKLPTPEDPVSQHEKDVKLSAYEEGFNKAKVLWEKGISSKKIAQQLAETELSNRPYNYVMRFQEGFLAGCTFQEEYMRDTNPTLFEEDDIVDTEEK